MRGLYSAASGMLASQFRLDVVSNNLANATTNGFKRDVAIGRAFPSLLLRRIGETRPVVGLPQPPSPAPIVGRLGTGAVIEETVTRFEQGPLRETGNPLDLAVVGEGFFLLQSGDRLFVTRDGGFTRSAGGWLVAPDGALVLGADGEPIPIGTGEVTVTAQGEVESDGEPVGRLALVAFDNPGGLVKVGAQRFAVTDASGPPFVTDQVEVKQGFVEGSTVSVVESMIRMIEATRAYEAAQRVVRAYDETLGRATNELGRIA